MWNLKGGWKRGQVMDGEGGKSAENDDLGCAKESESEEECLE